MAPDIMESRVGRCPEGLACLNILYYDIMYYMCTTCVL